MGTVEQSCAAVESYLSVLDQSYGSFSVNQTTLAVSSDRYEREHEKAIDGSVDVYTKVKNEDDEILHIKESESLGLPSTTAVNEGFERAAISSVADETGVSCRITDVAEATILGIRDVDAERDTVYRLAVVFEASSAGGSIETDAVWHQTTKQPEPMYV